jgi:hypothetical protein
MYSLQNIIDNEDIFEILVQYLPLEYKILFSRIYNKNLLKFYDFNCRDYKTKQLSDLMCNNKHVYNYISDLKYELMNCYDLVDKYTEKYEKNIKELYSLPYQEFCNKMESSRHCNSTSYYIYKHDVSTIIDNSIYTIYVKVLIDHIESQNIDIEYDVNDKIIPDEYPYIFDEVAEYYMKIFEEDDDIYNKCICTRCGVFGHDSESPKCLLYDIDYVKYKTNEFITDILDNVISKSIHIAEVKEYNCKYICRNERCGYNKSDKCIYHKCKHCCEELDCLHHMKMRDKKEKQKLWCIENKLSKLS